MTEPSPTDPPRPGATLAMAVALFMLAPVATIATMKSMVSGWTGPGATLGLSSANFRDALVVGVLIGVISAGVTLVAGRWWRPARAILAGVTVEGMQLAAFWVFVWMASSF